MSDIEKVRDDLAAFELEALSLLLHMRAGQPPARNRREKWVDRLPGFRRAVYEGMHSGGREKVPREILKDDYVAVLPAVQWACALIRKGRSKWSPEECFCQCFGDLEIEFCRPFPCPRSYVEEFEEAQESPSDIAAELVGRRLGLSGEKVRKSRYRERNLKGTSIQCVLASLFLDLASYPPDEERRATQALVLDTLFCTGYQTIKLYYLVQIAHCLDKPIAFAAPDNNEVRSLCDQTINSSSSDTLRPFTRTVD